MTTRRELLTTSAAAALALTAPKALAGVEPVKPSSAQDPALQKLFDALVGENLRLRPESATRLGMDRGAFADLTGRLSDVSVGGRQRDRDVTADQISRLRAIDTSKLNSADLLNLKVVLYAKESQAAIQAFSFGGASYGPSPYVVSQLTGAYQATPDFLDTNHRIETEDDAAAYLARLSAYGRQLDDNTAQMAADADQGVIPPDFLLDLALVQMRKSEAQPEDALVVRSLERRAAAKGFSDRYAKDATRIYAKEVGPALSRQIAATEALRARATPEAGVWRFRDGEAFYRAALHTTTTTGLSPEEVHQIGLDQAAQISARLDKALRAYGLSVGTVGARMAGLYKDPSLLYPNTDAGKVEAIAYCNGRLDAIRPRLPAVFSHLPSFRFEVRRVPVATEAGAASAFSQAPAPDGSRPGLVYFNLHDSAEWPKFCLATTVFHEGLPGHQLEGGLALGNPNLPLIRKMSGAFSGYGEGWALYAEQLADELGMYDDDPLGRFGYLKFMLFRANRCVVDTGLHHLRWSREKAIAYLVDQEGEAPGFAAREIERYCATPGQACSYKLGHTRITALRAEAQARLGKGFDIRAFHDAVLGSGRLPLDLLDQVTRNWIGMTANHP